MENQELFRNFPFLKDTDSELLRSFREHVIQRTFEPGSVLTREDETCLFLPVVQNGEIRVYQSSENGRELTLYRINEGESCILTTFSILNETPFPATAVTTESTRLFLVPSSVMQQWIARYEPWRRYIFRILSRRLQTTLITLSELAFKRLDIRLMELLLHRSMDSRVDMTHQQIANELGSAREVVSRVLKEMEREGLITLSRGSLEIRDKGKIIEKIRISSPLL